ncbi:MAG: hypothetical protein C5S48_09565 [Candidatus Methanogaster sp.]|nr:MAG: hypothetical protein C5S48_09565 [ANME-2 cluster archaeon]
MAGVVFVEWLNWHEEGSEKIALYIMRKLGKYNG